MMPSIAHVSFFVELLKFCTDNEKPALIDKICVMTKDPKILNFVLGQKWISLFNK